jgi:hypothetical protein
MIILNCDIDDDYDMQWNEKAPRSSNDVLNTGYWTRSIGHPLRIFLVLLIPYTRMAGPYIFQSS